MMPPASKHVLFYMVVHLVNGSPLVHDQRQEGSTNIRTELSNLKVVVMNDGILDFMSTFLRSPATPFLKLSESLKSSHPKKDTKFDPSSEKQELDSRRKKSLEDATIDVKFSVKKDLRGQILKMIDERRENLSHSNEKIDPALNSKGVKSNYKKVEKEKETKRPFTDSKEKNEKNKKKGDKEETLHLIQEGIEECGPDGERDKHGMCVFTTPEPL